MSDGALLVVNELVKHFPGRRGIAGRTPQTVRAVDGVSFSVEAGTTLGLVGESGSGKSTTGYCMLQLVRPTSGQVLFLGRDLTTLGGGELRHARRDLQIIFQDPYSALDPRMTVARIVREPLEAHAVGTQRSREQRVFELLDRVGFPPAYASRYPHEFSGGQRQRIGIARALALSPKLIVCDEPVSALDVSIQAQIVNLLKDLQDELGLAYVFISHDLAVVRGMSDEIAVMKDGRIVEHGPADRIHSSPRDAYTRSLLDAVPIPDPRRMRVRKAQRAAARAAAVDE